VGLPVMVFCCAVFVPLLGLMAILEGSWAPIQRAVIPLIILPLFLLLACEVSIRVGQKSKRILELRDTRMLFHAGRHPKVVKWSEVAAVRFEPICETAEHCVTLVETRSRKRKAGRPWALVLPWKDVRSLLVPELKRRMKDSTTEFEIKFRERRSEPRPKLRLPMLWFFALGMFLLVHGMPLLGVGLIGMTKSEEERRERRVKVEERGNDKIKLSAEGEKRFERFFLDYIGSVERFNKLCLLIGGTLTVGGGLLVGYDFRRLRLAACDSGSR
jgi:hypothetical protein